MFFPDSRRRTHDCGLVGIRDREVVSQFPVLVWDARRVEKGDLNGRLELDI